MSIYKKFAAALLLILCVVGALTFSDVSAQIPEWQPDTNYGVGDQVSYQDSTYQCLQAHTSLLGWEPATTAALWQLMGAGQDTPTAVPIDTPTPSYTPTPPPPTATPITTPEWTRNSKLVLTLSETMLDVGDPFDLSISVVNHGTCTYALMDVTISANSVITPNYIHQSGNKSFTFTATEAGSTTIQASGYGEYYCGYWNWAYVNGSSETITIVEATGPTATPTYEPSSSPTPYRCVLPTVTMEPGATPGPYRRCTPTVTSTPTPVTPTPTHTATPTPTPTPVTSNRCSVAYVPNDWGTGFTTNITITNNDSSPIEGYTLTWDYTGNQQLTGNWNADIIQSGPSFSASNPASAWNGTLAANGGSSTFGFSANYSGSNDVPAQFVLNGAVCN